MERLHCSRSVCFIFSFSKKLRVATVREKYLENEIFSRSEKSQEFYGWPGKFRKDLEVREKSGNLKINGYSRQTSENLFILFKRGKDVLSHEIV